MNKRKAQIELVNLDLPGVMDRMNTYAIKALKGISIKELQGLEAMDFVMDVMTKTCDGTRDWLNAATDDMETFLFGCLKSDIGHLKEKITRRKEKDIQLVSSHDEDTPMINGIRTANPKAPITSTQARPTGCDNLKDKEQYYTDILS